MASLVLSGDTSGTVTVSAPAVAGSNTQTLAAVTGTLAPIVSGTAVSASGTSVDFTDIPSWVKRITVMFSEVSLSGTSDILVQIGDSGGFETTGYQSASSANSSDSTSTAGFVIRQAVAADTFTGSMTILGMGSNLFVATHLGSRFTNGIEVIGGGNKTLSDTLTQVRITTVGGTNTFDAGTINILYE